MQLNDAMSEFSKYQDKIERILITEEMLEFAKSLESEVGIHRTKTSPLDSMIGILGEIAFAVWLKGNWSWHDPRLRRGQIDFDSSVEIKTSAFKFTPNLNLLVREDYAIARSPNFYVQVIIDIETKSQMRLEKDIQMFLCGYATHIEIQNAPLKDFGSKFGGRGGYKCHYIPLNKLHQMAMLRELLTP